MSIHDERDLRARLSVLLDGVEPSLPPVSRAVRQGRGILVRRWISVAAGLAVIAAGAALVPGFLQAHRVSPSAPLHYKVTVTQLNRTARDGVVGAGRIDNKRWQVVVNGSMGDGCALQPHLVTCGLRYGGTVGARQVSLGSGSVSGTQFEVGTVGADVTRVVIRLNNGTTLSLRPVRAGGKSWVAVVAPQWTITGAATFVGRSEYEHATPYDGRGTAIFVTWLQPGQSGLPVAIRTVGSGEIDGVSWQANVHTGPWGYCASAAGLSSCVPATSPPQLMTGGSIFSSLTCGPLYTSTGKPTGASLGIVAVPPDVKDVVLHFADGSRLRMAAIMVGGTRVVGYAIPDRPKVVGIVEYGVSGQLLHSASESGWGTGWGC
jgi:hypothetical protein